MSNTTDQDTVPGAESAGQLAEAPGASPDAAASQATEVAVSNGDTVIPLSDFLALSFGQLGISMAAFGILLTVIVVFFVLKTKEAAVAEAKLEMASIRDEMVKLKGQLVSEVNGVVREQEKAVMAANADMVGMRKDMLDLRDSLKAQIDETVLKALTTIGDMEAMRAQLDSKDWIYEIEALVTAKHKLSDEEQDKLARRSSLVRKKDRNDYTREDFVTLFTHHSANKDWALVEELARYAKVNFSNREIQCLGYFHLGNSFYYRGEKEKAEAEFRAAIERFGNISLPEARLTIAKCRNNLITVFLNEKGWQQGLDLADEALRNLDGLHEADKNRIRAKILINKGNCYSHLDRNEEAIEIYREVIETLGACPPFPDKPERIGLAHYNMACAYGLLEQPQQSIENLKEALAHSPTALADLPTDRDFLKIKDDPKFVEFLITNNLEYRLEG